MPKQQIRTNKAFLQSDFEGTNNNQTEANSLVAGNHNYINFENNVVAGDRNSAAGQAIILGNNNLVGNPSRVAVIGRDNILTSVEGMIIGASNSITTPVKNFNLFGVNGLSMTQSVNDVWIFGNPQNGTYSIGTQSFTNTLTAPTQSGIYLNQPVYLGPSVNIFNNNGSTLGNQNLNQVLTVGNLTGGQDIEISTGDIIKHPSNGNNIDLDLAGGGTLRVVSLNTLFLNANDIRLLSDVNNFVKIQDKHNFGYIGTQQTIGFTIFALGFANGNPASTDIILSTVNFFTFYIKGLNAAQTLGYYGELRVALRCDGAGNITQIGIDDLYEVSDFTTVTINSNFISATQMNLEITGEAGQTINYDISWRKI